MQTVSPLVQKADSSPDEAVAVEAAVPLVEGMDKEPSSIESQQSPASTIPPPPPPPPPPSLSVEVEGNIL